MGTATAAAAQQVMIDPMGGAGGAMGGLTQMQQIALMQSSGQAGGAGAAQLLQSQVLQNQMAMQNQMALQAAMRTSTGPSQAEQALSILKAAGTTTTMPQQQIA